MTKTITVRINQTLYDIFSKAADGEHRSISNFIEYATLAYVTKNILISDEEMNEITADVKLTTNIRKGLAEIRKGKYRFVD